ncbi:MAG: hypothetical protein IJD81_00245 [Oscillospiraceae bacterium]|nr:hypothetical protein [Oscillospiraceae bacterium]
MKQRLILLALCLMFILTACGQNEPIEDVIDQIPQPTPLPEATDSLSVLRSEMLPPVMAYANLGYPQTDVYGEVMGYLWKEYPAWMEETDFIGKIPKERFVDCCELPEWAFLVCVVPQEPDASVTVKILEYPDEQPEVIEHTAYTSEAGEPLLILSDTSDLRMTEVIVKDSNGREIRWFPFWDYYNVIPEDCYTGHHVMNFTPNSEKSAYQSALDTGYYAPALDELVGGSWKSIYGYALDLNDNSVPEDNGGWATIYDVDENGVYTERYNGSWFYDAGELHLSMTPVGNGYLIDNSFPVLTDPWGEGWLWIGRDEHGIGLPYFPEDLLSDVLDRSKG